MSVTWSNADTLPSWKKLMSLKGVSVKEALSAPDAAERVASYSVKMYFTVIILVNILIFL